MDADGRRRYREVKHLVFGRREAAVTMHIPGPRWVAAAIGVAGCLLLAALEAQEVPPAGSSACDENEQQFGSLLSGDSDATPDLLAGYCESECLSPVTSGVTPPANADARLVAMARLCARQDGEYCFPEFASALQILAETERDPVPSDVLQAACTPCARGLYRELLAIGTGDPQGPSPLDLACDRQGGFCLVGTRQILDQLDALDTTCAPDTGSACQQQLLEFATAFSAQDSCVLGSLSPFCGSRLLPTGRAALAVAWAGLQQSSERLRPQRNQPTASRAALMAYQREAASMQQQLGYATLLFQPTELLDMEFSGASF